MVRIAPLPNCFSMAETASAMAFSLSESRPTSSSRPGPCVFMSVPRLPWILRPGGGDHRVQRRAAGARAACVARRLRSRSLRNSTASVTSRVKSGTVTGTVTSGKRPRSGARPSVQWARKRRLSGREARRHGAALDGRRERRERRLRLEHQRHDARASRIGEGRDAPRAQLKRRDPRGSRPAPAGPAPGRARERGCRGSAGSRAESPRAPSERSRRAGPRAARGPRAMRPRGRARRAGRR